MALSFKDQAALCADSAWVNRVYAAACDVVQATVATADDGSASYAARRDLGASVCRDASMGLTFARLVAAGFGGTVTSIATPAVDTGTDPQIRNLVISAFNVLVR